MAKTKKTNIDKIDTIGFILSIFVLGFALYFIIFNFIHIKTLNKSSNLSITSTVAYEDFMDDYKNLKISVLKLDNQEFTGDMDKNYYELLVKNVSDITNEFGMFKLQPFTNSKSLGMLELYEIEQSSFEVLTNEKFDETIKLLDSKNKSKLGSDSEELIEIGKSIKFNRDSYMVDVEKYQNLDKYKEASFLGFNSKAMIESIEPDFIATMNNMNLAITNYVELSQLLAKQLGGQN